MTNHQKSTLWTDISRAATDYPVLQDSARTDVAIIGAGFTGLAAALVLADNGVSVRVLEAHTVGHGGSGRNAGLVNAGLWTAPDDVNTLLGVDHGERLNAALATAPDVVFGLISQQGIACDAIRNGTLHCALSARGLHDLQRRLDQQARRQAPVALLDAEETRARTGSTAFIGALHDRRAGTIQPLAYAQGLARAAQHAGARLHENTPARGWHHDGQRWQIKTDSATLTATYLIDATNAYGSSKDHCRVWFSQFATRPLTDDERSGILTNGEGCWDTAPVMSAFRLDSAGRMIMGGVGALHMPDKAIHAGWARRKIRQLYPQLANVPFTHHWHGAIAMTRDHLPKVIRSGPNAIRIQGYSGRGIGPGTVFGQAAANWVLTGQDDAFPLPVLTSYDEPLSRLRSAYYRVGAAAAHLLDARITAETR